MVFIPCEKAIGPSWQAKMGRWRTLRDSNPRYAKRGLRKFEEVFNLLLNSVLQIYGLARISQTVYHFVYHSPI